MEFPEIAHDRLLHQLDLPRQQHLNDTLAKAQQQQLLTPSTSTSSINEQTPLLPVIIDKLLNAEEQYAVHADELLTTWEIVRFEWRQLTWLSAPMVSQCLWNG